MLEQNNNNETARTNCLGSYECALEAAEFIRPHITCGTPQIGIICGSGLGELGERLENCVTLDYDTIPYFKKRGSGVAGHSGELALGELSGVSVICMKGRFHPYEGYEPWKVGFPIRVMKLLGVGGVIVTNAAGGMNSGFAVGDFMLLNDHIYLPGLMGYSPLVGPNDPRFGPRFPPMSDAYDKRWLAIAHKVAVERKERVHSGVYACVFGPGYETPAEKRFLQMMGADAVGMSTVHEVVTARHCGIRVLAISLITNIVVDTVDAKQTANHEEVLEEGRKRTADMVNFVVQIINQIKQEDISAPSTSN